MNGAHLAALIFCMVASSVSTWFMGKEVGRMEERERMEDAMDRWVDE